MIEKVMHELQMMNWQITASLTAFQKCLILL